MQKGEAKEGTEMLPEEEARLEEVCVSVKGVSF